MSDPDSVPTIAIHTIGHTPRPDLTADVERYVGSLPAEVAGALDGLDAAAVPACGAMGYPLETRLRDGTRVVVDAAFLQPRLQAAIDACDDRVCAHLVLCAGPFPRLQARHPLVRPFDAAVAELSGFGMRSLQAVVPFAAQAAPAVQKWQTAGFSCRAHALDDKPDDQPAVDWLTGRLEGTAADALVFDYVGARPAFLEVVGASLGVPVIDLGQLGWQALRAATNEIHRNERG